MQPAGTLGHSDIMRPHILLNLVDDWGSYDASHRIRALGREPDVHTPVIDRLSGSGVTCFIT